MRPDSPTNSEIMKKILKNNEQIIIDAKLKPFKKSKNINMPEAKSYQ